MHSTHSEK